MSRKTIPGHLKEFMESQIVRGSSGYEAVEHILDRVSQKDLILFLEFYEESVRDALVDTGASSSDSQIDPLAEQARKLQEQDRKKEAQADKFDDLLRSFGKED